MPRTKAQGLKQLSFPAMILYECFHVRSALTRVCISAYDQAECALAPKTLPLGPSRLIHDWLGFIFMLNIMLAISFNGTM